MSVIRVSAVVITDAAGRVLTVRKRGTARFMLPGGKPEPGESPAECLVREIAEEVGLTVAYADLTHLGRFSEAAANEPGMVVEGEVFIHRPPIDPAAVAVASEIAELRWLDPTGELPDDLAPLLEVSVLPLLAR
ncbi:NUDIX domain-containing protein [Mariniluteicoccus endophyticus]